MCEGRRECERRERGEEGVCEGRKGCVRGGGSECVRRECVRGGGSV